MKESYSNQSTFEFFSVRSTRPSFDAMKVQLEGLPREAKRSSNRRKKQVPVASIQPSRVEVAETPKKGIIALARPSLSTVYKHAKVPTVLIGLAAMMLGSPIMTYFQILSHLDNIPENSHIIAESVVATRVEIRPNPSPTPSQSPRLFESSEL